MNPENTKKLFEKYPKLFPKEDRKYPRQSLMCFGFECGDGWFSLIGRLCANIQNRIDKEKNPKYPQARVMQVKEKFGGLRFYIDGASDAKIFDIIRKAEDDSYKTCESCGKKGELIRLNGRHATRCKTCAKKA